MHIYTKEQIEQAIDIPFLMAEIEKGLILFSKGRALTANSSFLHFTQPPGDVHIKSCALSDEEFYVIKIASGFYENSKLGFSSSNGLMLLFSQKSGKLEAIFLDEGRCTDLRTALAGAIVAKQLANHSVTKIGIIGTGTQAREQLFHLQFVTKCRDVLVWGRNPEKLKEFTKDPRLSVFKIARAKKIEEIPESCDLIVTTTASTFPLLFGDQLRPGTHVTAIGADQKGKQELDSTVFDKADIIVVDSLIQCQQYGDLVHGKSNSKNKIIELGSLLEKPKERHSHAITVADLTGLAVEDLQVAKAVYAKLKEIKYEV